MADQRDRWTLIDTLFHAALEHPVSERGAYVRERAAGDDQLALEVEALLAADAHAHVLLDAPTPSSLPAGMRIGPYAIERILGSGGMATVYLARRADHQFDKHVAIKLVHQGLGAALAGGRFDTERYVLARLEHAHIARLLDAGLNEFGQPYLVMEWVDGVTLGEWLRETQPSLDRKLELWLELAGAVAYAHRNLIIHRDIKPSNVLVGRDGSSKLVDFGIAKLIGEGGEAAQTHTVHLTPRYASPEQLRGERVTTATDVFGLGLLLCELVTGAHPFEDSGGAGAGADAPDPVVASSAPADLGAIIRMAVRREPDRRYASAAELAEDVRRYRRGLPVLAQPESATYRLRKFASRHRVGVAAAGFVLAVVIGAAALVVRQVAVTAAERDRANLQARKAEQINTFLQNMLGSADPTRDGRDVRVVEVLDEASARLTDEMRDHPDIEADVRATLASTYQSLGAFDPALDHARRSLALRRALGSDAVTDVARSLITLGDVLFARGDYAAAEASHREALSTLEGAGLAESLDTADALRSLGEALNEHGQHDEAEGAYRRAIALYRRFIPQDDARVAGALNDLAVSLGTRSKLSEAEPLHREALAILQRIRGPRHLEVAQALNSVAGVLDAQGRLDDAERFYREALDIEVPLLGENHSRVIVTRASLGNLFWLKHDYANAEVLARAALAGAEKGLPQGHPLTAYGHVVLGQSLADAGRPSEAEPHLRAALDMRRAFLPATHWLIANSESVLGGAVAAQGRHAEAERLLLDGYTRLLADRGADDEKTRDARRRLAELYRAWGKGVEAARYATQ